MACCASWAWRSAGPRRRLSWRHQRQGVPQPPHDRVARRHRRPAHPGGDRRELLLHRPRSHARLRPRRAHGHVAGYRQGPRRATGRAGGHGQSILPPRRGAQPRRRPRHGARRSAAGRRPHLRVPRDERPLRHRVGSPRQRHLQRGRILPRHPGAGITRIHAASGHRPRPVCVSDRRGPQPRRLAQPRPRAAGRRQPGVDQLGQRPQRHPKARIGCSIRTYDEATATIAYRRAEEVVRGICMAYG